MSGSKYNGCWDYRTRPLSHLINGLCNHCSPFQMPDVHNNDPSDVRIVLSSPFFVTSLDGSNYHTIRFFDLISLLSVRLLFNDGLFS
ncbi:hypothetical protein CEXT_495121 [Caerostris extrusa]|uniref:Uncharacterized protein n=1 Tax=Caerostris extrusa TaxID=172846 RepID=A0AAV4S5E0_CAEEX|nr:hypothetical protein CEXT_495121 [Caerostris extrusa]